MKKSLRLVKAHYCNEKRIPYDDSMSIQVVRRNPRTSNWQFLINGALYEYERIDLSLYTKYKGLELELAEKVNRITMSKDGIINWFNSHTNLNLLFEDVGQVLVQTDKVSVVAAANSMRFKSSVSMRFK